MTEANELRRLAEAATPGPWIASGVTSKIGGDRFMFVNVEPLGEVARLPLPDRPAKGYAPTICDQRYIAAANPTAILSLLDELSLLRSENDSVFPAITQEAWDRRTDKMVEMSEQISLLKEALQSYRDAAVTSVTMEGVHYQGVSNGAFKHAWLADRAALSKESQS